MQYNQLITNIRADIYSNGAELITGDILQNILVAMVGGLAAAGACYKGVITTSSAAPADLDQATIYLALTAGTYTNFRDSNNDPIVTTGPALIIYEGGPSLVFSKTDLPFVTTSDLSSYLPLAGGTMTGDLDMNGQSIENVDDPVNNGDAANKGYVDSKQPWKVTIEPDADMSYILIRLGEPSHSCILAIDSASGAGALHGILCIDESFNITGAVFAGSGGLDTTVDAKSGYDDNSPRNYIAVLKFSNDQPVTITCIGGNAPQSAEALDALGGETFTSTRAWTDLEAGGGGGGVTLVTSWQNPPTDTDVPSEKLVYDSLGKKGVISQTQTWSGSGANRTYTMSGQVNGVIPIAFINEVERAGATFNSVSGYFELNGLTDLSYNEMMDIMRFGDMPYALASWMYAVGPIRTNFPPLRYLVNNIDTAFRNSDIEVIAFNQGANGTKLASSGAGYAFYSCRNLKKMIGVLDITTSTSGARFIQYAALLESFQIKGLKFSVEFSTPYMDKDSLLYLINNEASTGAITITLPATVYTKTQSGGEWYSDVSTALSGHPNVSLASA